MQDLVTTDWLYEHLNDENLRIIDIRGHVLPASEPHPHYFSHHAEYLQSHIPGAVFVDWVTDITNPQSPNASQIAPPEAYAALMSKLGIDKDTMVVAYDDASGMFAARMWWSLLYYGHENVAVMDGDWHKWVAEGRPTTADLPQIEPKTFIAQPNPTLRRTIDEVAQTSAILMDVRTPDEFNGKASRAKRAGHIPGAVNIPRGGLINADGTLRAPLELKDAIAQGGIQLDAPEVVVYCNGGVSASYGMLALRAAGLKNVAVYDGSWKEWGNDPDRPIS